MQDRKQPFAAFVLETLARQSTELGQCWVERTQLATVESGEPNSDRDISESPDSPKELVRTLLTAAADGIHRHESLLQAGVAMGVEAHRRERYRAIRHDLRNPLGTIKTAVTLLTDESVPVEMRESRRVRAMVVRNTSSPEQMIGDALGDAVARLRALDTSAETLADTPVHPLTESATSAREQRDDVARARQ
jgi:K+-sensing histidine kinase KdpD